MNKHEYFKNHIEHKMEHVLWEQNDKEINTIIK